MFLDFSISTCSFSLAEPRLHWKVHLGLCTIQKQDMDQNGHHCLCHSLALLDRSIAHDGKDKWIFQSHTSRLLGGHRSLAHSSNCHQWNLQGFRNTVSYSILDNFFINKLIYFLNFYFEISEKFCDNTKSWDSISTQNSAWTRRLYRLAYARCHFIGSKH